MERPPFFRDEMQKRPSLTISVKDGRILTLAVPPCFTALSPAVPLAEYQHTPGN